MRRPTPFLLALLLALAAACSGSSNATDDAAPTSGGTEEGWSFTDDHGTTIDLDATPEVVVAEVSMAGALWDLGYEVDATFGQRELPDGTTDPLGLADPEAFPSLGDVYGEVNLEELQRLQPDLIVTGSYEEGAYWGIDDEIVDDVEKIAPIAAITIPDKTLPEMAGRVAELGEALGVDLDDPQVTAAKAAYEEAEAALRDALAAKPDLTFMAASGTPETLYIAVPSGYADLETYQELGMQLVEPDTDEQYWEDLSWENADTYSADVILGDSRGGSVEQILEQIPAAARELLGATPERLARWEVTLAPGYANLARILDDLRAVVEAADPTWDGQ